MATTTPATARPAGTLSVWEGMARQYDYWLTVYKRTWRGGVANSFATPLFYVLAMGVLLGGFIDADPDQLEGATSYLSFIVPGLVAAHVSNAASAAKGSASASRTWNATFSMPVTCP